MKRTSAEWSPVLFRIVRVHFRVVIAALALAIGAVNAQSYPAKPVRVIVPFPAGGIFDLVARAVTDKVAASWGQPIIVEPRPGASGNIGAQLTRSATPDGYTLMLAGVFLAVNPTLDANSRFKAADFAGAALVGVAPNVFVVPSSLPVSSLKEFVEYAKARPGKLNAGHVGTGGFAHLCALLFAGYTGIELVIVPYKGQPQAIPDLLTGQISMMVLANTFVIPHVKSGKLKALAVTGATRFKDLPDVPTIVEAGFPLETSAVQWFGFVAPARTPKEIVSRFNAEVTKALKSPDVIDRLEKIGVVPTSASPQEYDAFIRTETERWSRLIRERNLKAD
jgi:tripartite-type tricarboxylate transporter receptor subunit TctC